MDVLFALLVIGSIILSNVGKKKRREQQEAQRKAAAAQARAAARPDEEKPVQPVSRPVPVRRSVAPAIEKYPSVSDMAGEGETAPAQAVLRSVPAGRNAAPPAARQGPGMQTTLRETPYQHRLDSSLAAGHAHEETSITGVQGDCAPAASGPGAIGRQARAAEPREKSAPAAVPGFVWDQNAVLSGVVMAEILGKPKCMRGHAR